jgi:carbonic anhydrase/acetyltransferase-like protein (isoleucine patch superfamily)
MAVYEFDHHQPAVADTAFIAPSAELIGRVTVSGQACVLFNAVLRGDTEEISVGEGSNIQDGVVVHADPGFPARIGSGVSVGHNATLHGCTVEDNSLIGMGATVLNGAVIGEGSLVAAGSVVLEGTVIPPRSLVAGIPAAVKRELRENEYEGVVQNAEHYVALSRQYLSAS